MVHIHSGMLHSLKKKEFLSCSAVKNLPAVQKMQVQSLDWEYPPEKEMPTHSSILTSEISWTEEPGELQSMGLQKSQI